MELNLDQITTEKYPFYHLMIKDNQVVACVKDPHIICWLSKCVYKKVCQIEKRRGK